jgi:tetratricopeptide (TPR) repeat protein
VGGAPDQGLDGPPRRDTGIAGGAAGTLVGRQRELGELTDSLAAVASGHGQLFLLEGEPGIGKTHLATALGEHARRTGFTVLWGRCWEDGGAPAFWPWTQILRDLVSHRLGQTSGDTHEPLLARVAAIVPELAAELGDADGDDRVVVTGRFALFDDVTTILRQAAASGPLLLLFDDLHAADLDSLRLLQFVARDLPRARIAIVATYRADDARRSGAGALLTRMGRDGRVLPLRGLTELEVGEFVERIAGEPARSAVVRTVHRATKGNPLFVDSITHLLVAEHRLHDLGDSSPDSPGRLPLPLPPNIREAIGMRLAALDEPTRDVLRVASVIGRSFTVATLATVLGGSPDSLAESLDVAVANGALTLDSSLAGRFTFDHMLVRDTLYGELPPRRRHELHGRIGTALEARYGNDAQSHATELAYHYLLAADSPDAVLRAVQAATRAGHRAIALAAYDEAAELFTRALETLESSSVSDPRHRCDVLLALGAARIRGGDTTAGRAVYLEVASIARLHHLPDQLAAAAIGYAGLTGYYFSGRRDDTLVGILEEALEALPAGDSEIRARLLARLSVAVYWSDIDGRRFELSEEAVAMARRLRDRSTLAMTIHSRRYAQWGPENVEQRLADATQCLQLALEANDLELAVSARRWRFTDLLEDGDAPMAERELDAHDALARRLQQPFLLGLSTQFRALWTITQGNFAEGERLAIEARQIGERAGNPSANLVFGQQMFPVWLHQRRVDELGALLAAMRGAPPHPASAAAMALIDAELGEIDSARAVLAQLATPGLAKFRHDLHFLTGLAQLSLLCVRLGDDPCAEHLYEQLAPYAGRFVVAGAPAQACWGPVDHYLGVLAAQSGVHDVAIDHFEAALYMNRRIGSASLAALTHCEYGLLLRLGDDVAPRATEHLDTARHTAEALEMVRVLERIDAALAEPATASNVVPLPVLRRADGDRADDDRDAVALRNHGEYWAVTSRRGTVHVRDSKGMHHLADLLVRPGQRVHVLELGGAQSSAGTPAIRLAKTGELDDAGVGYGPGFGDAGDVLDDVARSAYRARLAELDESIAEAERFNDIARASRLGEERDLLIDELARSVGIGGRSRRAASTTERARVNVTRAIRSAIRRIAELDPAAGRHLDATIVTGTYCVYEPGSPERR